MPTVDDRSMLLELDLAPCLCIDVAFYLDRSWHASPLSVAWCACVVLFQEGSTDLLAPRNMSNSILQVPAMESDLLWTVKTCCARCHLFHHTCFHNRGNSALPFHDSTHLFILPSTVTNYLHQQNGAHKEWPPAESMSKFMLTGSCGNSLKKKKVSDEIEAHKQLSWSFSLRPIWSMACSWYWTLSAIATKHVRITAFVGQQWSKTNVKVIPAFSGSRTAPQSWNAGVSKCLMPSG